MHPNDLVGPGDPRTNPGDRYAGRVHAVDRPGWGQWVELGVDGSLQVHILGDVLDDEVEASEGWTCDCELHPSEEIIQIDGRVARAVQEQAEPQQLPLTLTSTLQDLLSHVLEDHGVTCPGQIEGHVGPHGACANHQHLERPVALGDGHHGGGGS